jgi:FAD/FMN-containing dehydrogenase
MAWPPSPTVTCCTVTFCSPRGLDRFLALDRGKGTLQVEAGVSLGEIMRCMVPHGLFLPVTPGTRFATVGGAIANDVHGKNPHRAGTFGRHVSSFKLLRHDGEATVTPSVSGDGLFEATVGGLGLTGLIEWAEIKLQPISRSYLDVDLIPYGGLNEILGYRGSVHADA